MVAYVVDASVAIKWFFQAANDEDDLELAIALLRAHQNGEILFYQPPHFIAEVAAVLARKKSSDEVRADLSDLLNFDLQGVENTRVYMTACDLAIRLNHHLFDTLYHAVALHTTETTLITADYRYFDKAESIGQIIWLRDLKPHLNHP
ncbi:MAG: type II toxin-antitoxin system VapC family toxin [Candidatus Contendobacter sp.]|jgi:predicted nucleic acid-binding protein|nr:type II toxin-antitoxin system VapC family toxin [Gammaproteobacteria bacterium]MCC8994019.1 type II toxin-antitoxin system VapC family toxin [Candidatus Contendobacter sp.]